MTRLSRRTRWRAVLFRMTGVRLTVRMVMLALAENMGEDGRVSVPLTTMSARLNMAPRRILAAYADAIDAGLLARVSPGYEGHTAEYQALLPGPKRVPESDTLSDRQRVSSTSTLSASKSGTLSPRKRVPDSGTPVLRETSAFAYHLRSEPRAVNPAATAAVLFASLPTHRAATSTRPETRASAAKPGP